MDPLSVLRMYEAGENAVWVTEHMFGTDVMWGRIVGDRYVPQVIVSRQLPVSDWEWSRCCRAAAYREGGLYGHASQIIADIALDTEVTRVHR